MLKVVCVREKEFVNYIYNSLKKKIKYLGVNLTKDVNDLYLQRESQTPEERD
jgi:hypothetical protein